MRPWLCSSPFEDIGPGWRRTRAADAIGRQSLDWIDLAPSGLVGSTPVVQDLPPGGFDYNAPNADADTFKSTVEVPEGSSVRFRTDGDPDDGLDLWVYLDGELIAYSATGSSDEVVTGVGVPAGTYEVYVNAFAAGDGPATMRYDEWVVEDGADAGNLTLDPDPPRQGDAHPGRLSVTRHPGPVPHTCGAGLRRPRLCVETGPVRVPWQNPGHGHPDRRRRAVGARVGRRVRWRSSSASSAT